MTFDIPPAEPLTLPAPISTYLPAHLARDIDIAMGHYADDATVLDEGHTYRGRDEIRDWLQHSAGEYTYTTEVIGAERIDDEHHVVICHLEGDFPGGVVDLRFRFTLRDGRIAALTIAP